jgi:tripartite-type tricarboxylate transporter receptor subunit TctC
MPVPSPSRVAAALLAACALATSASAAAQSGWPQRPIRAVVPFPAGGALDQLARVIAQRVAEPLGQAMIVENRPGGGTVIGTDFAAKAVPDGHTVLMVANSFTIQPAVQPRLPYDIVRDFAPLTLAATTPHLLVVHPSLPVRSVQELAVIGRRRPGELNYASVGPGTAQHLAGEMYRLQAGIQLVHVPFQGSAPAVQAMLGGHIELMFANLTDVAPHLKAGRMRAVAVATAQRIEGWPDLPTLQESGFAGFESASWFGALTNAAVPAEVARRLSAEIARAVRASEARERLAQLGLTPVGSSAEAFGAFLRSEIAKYARVVRDAGVRID